MFPSIPDPCSTPALRAAVLAAGLCVVGMASASRAEPPGPPDDSQPPATRPHGGPEERDRGDGERGEGGRRDHGRDDAPPSPEELAEVEAFYAERAPHRYGIYQRLREKHGDDAEAVRSSRRRMVGGHRRMESMKENNPRLYGFVLEQMVLTDRIEQTARELRENPGDEALPAALRDLVRRRVDNLLAAREARLEKLRADVAREQDALKEDRRRVDELVDEQVKKAMGEGE